MEIARTRRYSLRRIDGWPIDPSTHYSGTTAIREQRARDRLAELQRLDREERATA